MEINSDNKRSDGKTGTNEDHEIKPERSYKEQRIREVTLIYYSRADVRKALFEFSKNRECVPRYFEGFGKRPDSFQYDSDVLEHVRRGATSFHCSEELWTDPLEISNELSKDEFNELRIGWDLLIDVDSPYLEYSKIYAKLLVDTLKFHGIENIGVKYSGSKGFHIIVSWKAFPKEIYRQKTKDMFPEWPRIICEYLAELIQPKLEDKILDNDSLKELAKKTGEKEDDLLIMECRLCHRQTKKKFLINWLCPNCKTEIQTSDGLYNNRRKSRCPNCREDLIEISRKEIYFCEFCNIDSEKNPNLFGDIKKIGLLADTGLSNTMGDKTHSFNRYKTEKHIDVDLVLVAPRHLFRMPYSLHEKTALASIVIDKNKIRDFNIKDANPFKVEIKSFYPNAKESEARELLLQALDWKEQKDKFERINDENKSLTYSKSKEPYKKISIPNPPNEIFPPCIKDILKGIKQDGRKRALFIIINFFKSLGLSEEELEKIIYKWNEKNSRPLKKGYIQSQLNWFRRNPVMMPQNCTNPIYNDLGICKPEKLCRQIKNPLNYSIKSYFKYPNSSR